MRALRGLAAVAAVSIVELYRRRDLYVALFLGVVTLIPLASVNLFGVQGVVRYLREVSLLLIWLFSIAIAITTAARQLPAEIEQRTILPLLSKPIRRDEVILGKYLGAFAASGSSLLLFYLGFVVLSGLREGIWFPSVLPQAVLLHLSFLALLTAAVLFGSVFLTPSGNVSCNALLALGMLLFGDKLAGFTRHAQGSARWLTWAIHWVAPHYEFFDLRLRLVHGWDPLTPGVLGAVLLYCALYTAALLGGAVWLFRRKLV
jgi:ABC-type transport system involved in multi-copper enzyme maturation permease subunit